MHIPQNAAQQSANHEVDDPGRLEAAAIDARNRANVFSFLATLLNGSPDLSLARTLKATGGNFIAELAQANDFADEVAKGFQEMAKYADECKDQLESVVQQDLAVDWTRVFRGVSPAYSPTPPYEACYTDAMSTELQLIQAVNQLYLSNGLLISNDYNNRPDYIGLEFAFLAHLAEAETQAWEEDHAELAKSYQETARSFLREHLRTWVDKYVTRAMGYARTGFYRGILHLCRGVVSAVAG